MQDSRCGLPRIPLPRTRVNKPLRGARTAGRPDAASRRGRPTFLPGVGPRHGKIASAVHRDREWVGELAHEGAVGGEVSPRQVAQAPVRPFHQLATVERAQGVTDEEVVGGEAERAQGVVGDEVVRRPGLRMYRFM